MKPNFETILWNPKAEDDVEPPSKVFFLRKGIPKDFFPHLIE